MTYRAESADAAELIPGGKTGTLRDRHGQPLELLYGVLIASPPAPEVPSDHGGQRRDELLKTDDEHRREQHPPRAAPDATGARVAGRCNSTEPKPSRRYC